MMIGNTLQETGYFCSDRLERSIPDDDALAAEIGRCTVLADLAEEKYRQLVNVYRREMPNLSNAELLVRIGTDVGMWRNTILQATRKIEAGDPPVFVYEFAWKTPPSFGGSWAPHDIDLPFVFGHPDYPKAWDDNDSPALRAAAGTQNARYPLAAQTMDALLAAPDRRARSEARSCFYSDGRPHKLTSVPRSRPVIRSRIACYASSALEHQPSHCASTDRHSPFPLAVLAPQPNRRSLTRR